MKKQIRKLRSMAAAILLGYGMRKYDDAKFVSRLIKPIFRRLMGNGLLLHLKLDLTEKCNKGCAYCYSPRRDIEPALADIIGLFSKVKGFVYRLDLLGGEPMLRQDIYEVIRAAKRNGRIRFITLFTNGTLIDTQSAARLKQAGLDAAFVSFYSSMPGLQDQISGQKGTFDAKISGIRALIGAGIKTSTFTVINKNNLKDIEPVNNLIRGLGANPCFFNQIPLKKEDMALQLSAKEVYEVKRTLEKISPRHMSRIYNTFKFTGHTCFGGYFMLSIKADGTVTHCPFVYDVILGNAYKEDILEVFQKRLSVAGFKDIYEAPGECSACSYVSYCRGGCKAGNRIALDDYNRRSFYCLGPWKDGKLQNLSRCIPYWL